MIRLQNDGESIYVRKGDGRRNSYDPIEVEPVEHYCGTERKIKPIQLGYESRCSRPNAFDVMLGSQLGVGAYRALVEHRLNRVMVSVSGQLDLEYVAFDELIDPDTLVTVVRHIEHGSDFHRLARFLETDLNK